MKDKGLKLEDVDAPHTLGGASDVDKSSTLRNNNKHTACHTTRRTSFKLFRGQILIDFSSSYREVSLNGLQQPDFSGRAGAALYAVAARRKVEAREVKHGHTAEDSGRRACY